MLTTNNLGLLKPELTDPADITALNANWDKIDDLPTRCKHVVDADLNTLLEEGLYVCTGNMTNSPDNATVALVQVVASREHCNRIHQTVYYYSETFSRRLTYVNSTTLYAGDWKKHVYGDVEVISDTDAPLGGYYAKEYTYVNIGSEYDLKLFTISGSVSNCDHLIKQIDVGYEIRDVISCMMTPNTDHGWMCVTPSFSGTILTLTFDAYDDDAHIPCSFIVKLLTE